VLPPPELEPPLVPPELEPELPEEPEDDPPEDPEDPLLLLVLSLELLPEDDDDPFVLPVDIEPELTLPPPRLPAMEVLIETMPLTLFAVFVPMFALLLLALEEPLPAQGLLPGGN
jgi:hypothetical protein